MTLLSADILLPSGWSIAAPPAILQTTGTLPQGAAASPNANLLAVVESGFNPPALRIFDAHTLRQVVTFPLKGAYGRPVWLDDRRVMVPGANAHALYVCNVFERTTATTSLATSSYPIAVAFSKDRKQMAVVNDDATGTVTVGKRSISVGLHPWQAAFSSDGRTLYVSVRSASHLVAIDTRTFARASIPTGLHPSALLLNGDDLYVAESDAGSVGVYDTRARSWKAHVFLGLSSEPNALAASGNRIFVSLGAANNVAILEANRLVAKIGTGWYPTDVVPLGSRIAVIDGKGEGSRANPKLKQGHVNWIDYVGAIEFGSIRLLDPNAVAANPQGMRATAAAPRQSVIRSNGPIKHVFFILKENRSYDQILGDLPQGNGDPRLVLFGANVTPNQHALAMRFGLLDNMYASGEVSDAGHNWADEALANDYVEREWPNEYAGRRSFGDNMIGTGAAVPQQGYIWDEAEREHISFRDYGEMALLDQGPGQPPVTAPSLKGLYDPNYVSFNLDYSDVDRAKEWQREFDAFVAKDEVPRLEYIWIPNDHTAASRVGKRTPAAMVADNDAGVGRIVDAISHSPIWKSSAIFITEDDAQDGADHVSAQRTTLYIASPYTRGGTIHERYSTMSVLRTMELILGMKPLSNYDATARPLYAAFTTTAHLEPFDAIAPKIDVNARNAATAYASRLSATLDLTRPDAVSPDVMLDILAHNHTP